MRTIYTSSNKNYVCLNLLDQKIDYFTVENVNLLNDTKLINTKFFSKNFIPSFKDEATNFEIYSVKKNCFSP